MKRAILIMVIITVTVSCHVSSQTISDLLEGYKAYNRFQGCVLVAQNGEIILQKGYGYSDRERNIPVDAYSLFSLASVTKTLTATAIFRLHQEDKLSVYDRVDRYIPGFINANTDSLTIMNFLNHTSGMSANIAQVDITSNEAAFHPGPEITTIGDLIEKFRDTGLKSKPGTRHNYNNYGYLLLAYIIEKVSGMDYYDYMEKEFFPLAGMVNTYSQAGLPVAPAKGYTGFGSGKIKPLDYEVYRPWLKGAAGLYSSSSDLYRFVDALLSFRLLNPETMSLMLDTCVTTSRGNILMSAGWQKQNIAGKEFYSHGGSIEGFSTRIGFVPGDDLIIIVLSNLVKDTRDPKTGGVSFSSVDLIAEDIIRIINREEVAVLPLPSGKADKKHQGTYRFDGTGKINVTFHKDSLVAFMEPKNGFTLFDQEYYREIADTTGNYRICKLFASMLTGGSLNGFERYANDQMKKVVFHESGMTGILNMCNRFSANTGPFSSFNIYEKTVRPGSENYSLVFHSRDAELTMEISFGDDGLINGFFVMRLIPRCKVYTVALIPTGRDEYFIDGFGYGGFKDMNVRYDKKRRSLTFSSDRQSLTAYMN